MRLQLILVTSFLVGVSACADSPVEPGGPYNPTGSDNPGPTAEPAAGNQASGVRVTVNPPSAVIQVGSSILLTTVIRDGSSRQLWEEVSWSVSDPTIASVSAGGVVTGLRPGDVMLKAACAGAVGTAPVTVKEPNTGAVVDELTWTFVLDGQGLAPLYDVWGSSATDVFAVGSSMLWDCCGTILHFDGAGWSYMALPENVLGLTGVWGSSPRDVFAVGDGILHYDGVSWSRMATPDQVGANAVWGSSATDVYAVGSGGVVLHYDGARWTRVRDAPEDVEESLTDIWGTPDGDFFAVGSRVLRLSGGVWSEMQTPPVGMLLGVWGTSSTDVFAVGVGGAIIHYDGSAWRRMNTPARDGDLLGIRGNSPQDVYAVGDRNWWGPGGCCSDVLHFDGSSWRELNRMTGQAVFGVWTTPDEAVLVGSGPTIIRGIR